MVEIVTAEVGVTVGGLDLEHTVSELHDGNIECTATEVEHGDFHVLVLLVKAVCKGCRSRLVDNSLHIETCNLAGFLGCLALGVREICRHGDDSLSDRLAEIILCSLLHLLENHC